MGLGHVLQVTAGHPDRLVFDQGRGVNNYHVRFIETEKGIKGKGYIELRFLGPSQTLNGRNHLPGALLRVTCRRVVKLAVQTDCDRPGPGAVRKPWEIFYELQYSNLALNRLNDEYRSHLFTDDG